MIHGLRPGPLLIKDSPRSSGRGGQPLRGKCHASRAESSPDRLWVKILKVPYHYLFSLIVLFCIIGSYVTNNNPYDVVIMDSSASSVMP